MPSLVEIGPVVQEKIFKFCLCILLFHNYLPLELFVQTLIPFRQGCFAPSLEEIDRVVLKKMKM